MTPIDLPPEWRIATLADVAARTPNAIVDGPFGSNLKLTDYTTSGVPVLQGKNITNNEFRWFDIRYISEQKASALKRSSVAVGDILIIKIGSIGYSAIIRDIPGSATAIIPANLAKVTPDTSVVDTQFLHKWLTSPVATRYLVGAASKTAQPALSLSKIKQLPIPLPPLTEQRRIAEVLDRAEALRAKRREAIALLDTLTESIFLDMFGDPVCNSHGWPLHRISDYVAAFEGGKSFQPEDAGASTRRRVLKISAVTSGRFLPEESKPVADDHQPEPSHFVREGDLLISRANTAALVGAVALVDSCPPDLLLPDKLWRFVWRRPLLVEVLFVRALFQSPSMRRAMSRNASGTGGSMKNISKAKLMQLQTIVPPLEVQHQFADVVTAMMRSAAAYRASLVQLDALFASLQYRAFRGEL